MIDKRLLALVGKDMKYIYGAVACMVVTLLASTGSAAAICGIIGVLTGSGAAVSGGAAGSTVSVSAAGTAGGMQDIYKYLIIMVVCIVVRFASDLTAGKLKDTVGRNVRRSLRDKAYDKLVRLGSTDITGLGMSGLTQVCLEGIEQLDLYYSSYIPQFFYAMAAPIILFIICLPVCPRSSVTLLLCVPLIPVSIIMVSRYAKKIFAKYWDKYISMGGEFLDSVSGLSTLKIFRADARWHKKLNASAEEFRRITMKVLVMQLASTTIMDTVAYGGAALGITAALVSMYKYGMSPVKALFIVLVAVDFFLPLRKFGSAFHVAMNGASAGRKLLSVLDMPEPEWGDRDVESCTLELRDVDFSYESEETDDASDAAEGQAVDKESGEEKQAGDRESSAASHGQAGDKSFVLRGISMTFPRGMSAIVGESGSGKSTIVGLLMGVLRAESGSVLLGGVAPEELSRYSYYSHLSVVSTNTKLFAASVRDNFRMACPGISDDEIVRRLRTVRLDDIADEGLDKVLTEGSLNVSGGQRQRLALAVNLAADKDIYIFDEATSNIDSESEGIIMEAVRELARTKTVIVISHRLANVVSADTIYYMEHGAVKEYGSHDDLMKLGGGYARLYDAQKALEYRRADAEANQIRMDVRGGEACDVMTDTVRDETDTHKKYSTLTLILRLMTLLGSFTFVIILAVLCGVVGAGFGTGVTTLGAVGVAEGLTDMYDAESMSWMHIVIALCILCGVLRGAMRLAEQYFNHYIAFRLLAILRDKIFAALRLLCPAKLETKRKGSIIAMITADIETLEVFYAHTVSPVCIAVIYSIIVLVLVRWIAGTATMLVLLAGYLMIGLVLPVIFAKITRKTGVNYREEFSSFNAYFLEGIEGLRDILLYRNETVRREENRTRTDKLLNLSKRNSSSAVLASAVAGLMVTVVIAAVLLTAVYTCSTFVTEVGYVTLMDMSGIGADDIKLYLVGRVVIASTLAFSSFGPVLSLAALPGNLTQTFASADRVIGLLDEEPVVRAVTDGEDMTFTGLRCDGVSFGYGDRQVLGGISLDVRKGEIVGIMGPSGCGKSTLLRLLMRVWKKDGGHIYYGDMDIDDINTESLLRSVTMVSQDTYLFDETIEENLRVAKEDATDAELAEACRKASVYDFITGLPEGFRTRVGAGGSRLSAGERQRIGLARAFLSDAELILLDEPTSNVDSINEGIILQALDRCRGEKTIVIVSHRQSTMAVADRVYYLV